MAYKKNECSDTTYTVFNYDFDLQLVRLHKICLDIADALHARVLWYANQLRNGMQCACASAVFVPFKLKYHCTKPIKLQKFLM